MQYGIAPNLCLANCNFARHRHVTHYKRTPFLVYGLIVRIVTYKEHPYE